MSESESTKTKLLDAAEKIIQSEGFAACLVPRVAEEAGVTGAMVNHHFKGGKTQLITECVERYNDKFQKALHEIELQYRDFNNIVDLYIDLHNKLLLNDSKICLCSAMMGFYNQLDSEIQEALSKFVILNNLWLSKIFSRHLRNLQGEDIEQRTRILIVSMGGMMLYYRPLNWIDKFFSDTKSLFIRVVNGDLKPL